MPARAKEATMQYALLIYDDEAAWEALSEAEMTSAMAGYYDFTDRVVQRGAETGEVRRARPEGPGPAR
jgi:hypothetical protein